MSEEEKKEELEADALASEILLPEKIVKDYLDSKDVGKNFVMSRKLLEDLAAHFKVSLLVAIQRLRNLGYYVPYIDVNYC